MDWESEIYLQWDGCPQGLASAAPGFNLYMVHGFNTALGFLRSQMWVLYTDDLLLFGESAAHVHGGDSKNLCDCLATAWQEGITEL